MGFQDFLQKCEILEFDFDPKAIQQGRLHARDMQKFKVSHKQRWSHIALASPTVKTFCRVALMLKRPPPGVEDAPQMLQLVPCMQATAEGKLMCSMYPPMFTTASAQGDKYGSRPISELDVNAWEVCATLFLPSPPAPCV